MCMIESAFACRLRTAIAACGKLPQLRFAASSKPTRSRNSRFAVLRKLRTLCKLLFLFLSTSMNVHGSPSLKLRQRSTNSRVSVIYRINRQRPTFLRRSLPPPPDLDIHALIRGNTARCHEILAFETESHSEIRAGEISAREHTERIVCLTHTKSPRIKPIS